MKNYSTYHQQINPSPRIKIVSAMIFLLPAILAWIVQLWSILGGRAVPWAFHEWISVSWSGFVFYGFLAWRIWKLSNKARVITVIYMLSVSAGPVIGMIVGTILAIKEGMLLRNIHTHGFMDVVIFPWILIFLFILPHAVIGAYLNRREIKGEFL